MEATDEAAAEESDETDDTFVAPADEIDEVDRAGAAVVLLIAAASSLASASAASSLTIVAFARPMFPRCTAWILCVAASLSFASDGVSDPDAVSNPARALARRLLLSPKSFLRKDFIARER